MSKLKREQWNQKPSNQDVTQKFWKDEVLEELRKK